MVEQSEINSPDHADQTIRSVIRMHAEHHERASLGQRIAGWAVERLGRPAVAVVLSMAVGGWVAWNLAAPTIGFVAIDPPPFPGLQGAVSVLSLFALVLVLSAQRHEDHLNKHRDLLALELALLSEQKTAKVIQLIEELRRDSPHIHDRVDATADRMSQPADADAVMEQIKQSAAGRPRTS